ncbi:MORN repeat-containing protein 3-like [Neocloeon triangulifer]|uniref:MORN repeat-containing protein 3-like n=1 Tax=Neocloeon triangulifer TaxID=2078957 RepID=UPI00286EB6BA|nr:MORN repeat-containing protein 3-like [Neocloeon triangulifer]
MPTLKEHFYGLSRSRLREEATKKCGDLHEIYSVNGDCFRGHWWKDKKDGLGEQRKVDGYKYHGLWSQNKRDGYGILKKKDFVLDRVDVIYDGQWCMGRPDGLGIGFLPDGTYYEGEYRKGLRSGWGTMMHSNGSQTSGQWLKDRVNGVATWWNSNGNFYTGEFKDGKFHGKGVYVMPSRGKMLQGVWMDNQFFKGISKDLEDESKRAEEILEE